MPFCLGIKMAYASVGLENRMFRMLSNLLFRDAYKIDLRMRMKIAKSRIDIVLSQQRELMLDKYPNLLNRDTQSITKVTKTIET